MAEPRAETSVEPKFYASLRITEAGIAILPVMGTLVRRGSWMAAECGLTSYHDLEGDAREAFTHPDVRGVLLEIDSGGGEASGLFDFVASLRNMANSTGKPLWAVADEAALSAAYAIACAADKIFVPRTAEVGSVGVVALHVDESAADAQAGRAYTYIHAGARKVDGNPHEALSPDVKNLLQADVDALYTSFVELVATRRGCSLEHIRATEAAVFRGQKAVSAGLADAVGTMQQAHDQLVAHVQTSLTRSSTITLASQEKSMPKTLTAMSAEGTNPAAADVTTPTAETLAPTATVPMQPPIQAEAEAAVCARFTDLAGIARQAQRLGVSVDPIEALRAGISPDALRQKVLEEAAAQDAATHVVTAHSVEPAPKAAGSSLTSAVQQLCNIKDAPHA